MNAVVLNLAGRDLGKHQVAEEGIEMLLDAILVALDVYGAALPLRDSLELVDETGGRLFEGLSFLKLACAIFA